MVDNGYSPKSKNMALTKKIIPLLLVIILGLGFILRLYKVSNPVADWHSWRQADTSAVTRNFVKHGINLLYPQYDDYSDVSGSGKYNPNGYRFVEFPVFNLFHLFTFKMLPFLTLEEAGRITSAIAATISALCLFFLSRRHANQWIGIMSAFFYVTIPFNIYFTRVILPDPLMVTLFLITLNMYDLYSQNRSAKYLLATCVFGALAVLVKPVALFFLLPITILQFKKYRFGILKAKEFYIIHLSFLLPFGLWRLWSYRHPEGIPASKWLLNGNGIRYKPAFLQWIFGTRIGILILAKWGVWPFMAGLVSAAPYGLTMALGAVLYLITFATGNVQHDYYQIPIIPAISMLLAMGVAKIWQPEATLLRTLFKRAALIVCVMFMLAFGWYDTRGLYQINNGPIVTAGIAVDKIVPADAVVIAPYQGDTAFLYQTNRPGFAYLYKPLKDIIDKFHATYYVSVNYDDDTNEVMNKYTVVEKNPSYVIIKLEEQIKQQITPTP